VKLSFYNWFLAAFGIGFFGATIAACGGSAPEDAQYAGDAPAQPTPQGHPGGGYGQPGQTPQPGMPPPPPGAPPALGPKPTTSVVVPERQFESLDRDRSTIESALAALDADETLLLDTMSSRATELALGRTSCDRVCAAIGSMRRSVLAVCELAGEDDARCKKAQSRLGGAEKRVSDASCSCS
jgi:hypothetical protein